MNISSLGAYSTQALNLISRLGTSDAGTRDDDLVSLLESRSDSLSLSAQGQWLSRSQESNPFKVDFDDLGSLISSGDLASAKTAYTAMKEKLQSHGSGDDPMAADFAAIGSALEAGDATAAQEAWTALSEKLDTLGPPPPPPREDAASGRSAELKALMLSRYWQSSSSTDNLTKA